MFIVERTVILDQNMKVEKIIDKTVPCDERSLDAVSKMLYHNFIRPREVKEEIERVEAQRKQFPDLFED